MEYSLLISWTSPCGFVRNAHYWHSLKTQLLTPDTLSGIVWKDDFLHWQTTLVSKRGQACATSPVILGDVERVQHKHVVVVLGQCDEIAFGGDFQPTAAAHLDVGALELADERAVALEDAHVEAVAVTVANQHVARVADVDSVREVGDVLAAHATQELAVFVEYNHAVPLDKHTSVN